MKGFYISFAFALLALAGELRAAAPAVVPPAAGVEQRLGAQLPPDVLLRDESGRPVRSDELWQGRPLLLVFAYFSCPGLCPLVLDDLQASLAQARLTAGKDATVAVVSIDPRDDPAAAAATQERLGVPGWRLLTGAAPETRRLAAAAGIRYERDAASGEYRHAAVVVAATRSGRVARYLRGPGFAARDVRFAVTEAEDSLVARPIDQLFLFCYHYDARTGRYDRAVGRLLRAVGACSLAGLGALVWRASRPRLGGVA
jgi:protein SCO1/2